MKEKLKKVLYSIGLNEDIPPTLLNAGKRYYVLGVIFILAAIVFVIALRDIKAFLFPALLGVLMIILGFTYINSVKRHGFDVKEGRCVDHTNLIKLGKGVDGFTLQTADEVLYVPTTARHDAPPIGCPIRVFVKSGATSYVQNGVRRYNDIYGYEIMPEDTLSE